MLGERVHAVVVVAPGHRVDLEEIGTHFADAGLARHKTPEQLTVTDDLLRTASGKVQKQRLRQQLLAQREVSEPPGERQ